MQSRGWAITWRKFVLLVAFVTTIGVCSLPAQTPQDLELLRAGRQFRRQVYLQYRTNRPEFDRRRAAAAHAEAAYRAAGADEASAERLRTWLLAAAAASQSGAALPESPNFGAQTRVAESQALPSPMTGETQGPQPPKSLEDESPAESILEVEEAEIETAETPVEEPADVPQEAPIEEPVSPPMEDSHTPVAEPSSPPTDSPYQDEMPVADAPNTTPPADELPFEDAHVEDAPVDETAETPFEESVEDPFAPATPETESGDEPAGEMEVEATETEAEVDNAPFDDATEEATEEAPGHEMTPAPVSTPAETPEATFEPNRPSSSGVNVNELTSRIAGHNFAVRGILLDWRRSGNDDVDELTQAVEQTEALGRRYGLLRTYLDLLTTSERGDVEKVEPLDSVFVSLGNAIADLRESLEASDAPEAERTKAVARLNELSKRLAVAYEVYEQDAETTP
jgi:hypothetical protein